MLKKSIDALITNFHGEYKGEPIHHDAQEFLGYFLLLLDAPELKSRYFGVTTKVRLTCCSCGHIHFNEGYDEFIRLNVKEGSDLSCAFDDYLTPDPCERC